MKQVSSTKRLLAVITATLALLCSVFLTGTQAFALRDTATYTGTATVAVFNYGLTVTVTMEDDLIQSITAEYAEDCSPSNYYFWNLAVNGTSACPSPLQQIVDTQSTENIDVVSGATYTCLALIEAVDNALASIPDPTTPPESIPGDVDGNGSITLADAVITARAVMGLVELSETQFICADINCDGQVTIADAVMILRIQITN